MPAAPTTANAESLAAARAESFKVVIVTHTGSEPSFKITKSSTIGELRAAYGEWQHVPVNQIRLIHHGHGLADEITGEYVSGLRSNCLKEVLSLGRTGAVAVCRVALKGRTERGGLGAAAVRRGSASRTLAIGMRVLWGEPPLAPDC
jgi:hypothetical protein